MANFIEIPIVVIEDTNDDVDYEGLGIDRPDPEYDTIMALVNLDNIGRINPIEDSDKYKTVLFYKDEVNQPIMRTPLSYEQVKSKIL